MGGIRATPPMGWTAPQAEVLPRQEKGRAAFSLSDRNKKRKLVVGGKTRLVECDSTEEPYSIEALARYN
jgi:hypothetical protein